MQAWYFIFALLFALNVNGHSMMTCAVQSGNTCVGAVRDASKSLVTTNYHFDGINPCQPEARGVANLASKYSTSNPMGRLQSGQTFTIQWTARNHAVANQNPLDVKIFLSPAIQSGQTDDYSWPTFRSNMICKGPFINCGKGPNVDVLLDPACTLSCTLPTLSDGVYTMLWHWNWTQNDGNNYMTCADLQIGSGNAPSQTPVQTSAPPAQQSSASSSQNQAQTSAQRTSAQPQQSSPQQNPASSASNGGASSPTETTTCPDLVKQCKDTCGENSIASCSCIGGKFSVTCGKAETASSSSVLTISAIILTIAALL